MTSVLVAAQSEVVRAGLASLIVANPDLTLAGGYAGVSIKGLARQIDETRPEVVLVDLNGQDQGLLKELLGGEVSRRPDAPAVVMLMDDNQESLVFEALRAGVSAILPSGATTDEITAAVLAAAEGLVILRPETVEVLLSAAKPVQELISDLQEPLTPRENEVLSMMAEGLGNKTIAFRLGISEHTVKFHVGSIFGKLGVSSRTEAVAHGIRQGLIMI